MTAYLDGALKPGETAAAETHLVACTKCREAFAGLMRLLNREGQPVTPEEESELAVISSGWKGRPVPVRHPRPGYGGLFAILAIAATCVLGVLIWTYGLLPPEPSGSEIVQLLLKEDRPFEPRLAGQAYREFEQTRGVNPSPGVDYDLLADAMTRLDADAYSMGRFYLLRRDLEKAIPLLEKAAAQPGASAAVYSDLGAAYMSRGDNEALERAREALRSALQADAGCAPAVFNLALYFERTGSAAQAQEEWRHYMRLDPESGWSQEARLKLEVPR